MGKLFKMALGLFLIGVGLVAVFALLTESDVIAITNDEDYVYHELVYDADDFTKFDLDFENRDFFFRPSSDENIKIVYYTTEKDPVVVSESGSTLEMLNDVKWYDSIFMGLSFLTNNDFYDVYIYLPDTQDYEVYLVNDNGIIDIMELDNLSDLYVSTSNGRITLDAVSADAMDLNTSNGEVRLTDVTTTGDLDFATSNGRVYLTNVDALTIDGSSSNGRMVMVNVVAQDMDFDTSNGDIEIEINGDKADYEIFLRTSNGSKTYDGTGITDTHVNDGAQYIVHLDTSNGDIEVTFSE